MLIQLRRKHPVFRRKRFFEGRPMRVDQQVPDISWLRPSGEPMTDADWGVTYARTLTMVLNGSAIDERDQYGQRLRDTSFALFFNASHVAVDCMVPGRTTGTTWRLVFDTSAWPAAEPSAPRLTAGSLIEVGPRSLVVIQQAG